jgi:deoxyribodipyrimidine photo-lyase
VRRVVVLFTRDLRVHDHPALADAVERADQLVPLFVLDDRFVNGPPGTPNRLRFLLESLADLRQSLRRRGGELVVARGDTAVETMRAARRYDADGVFTAADVSYSAARRERRLAQSCRSAGIEFVSFPGITVVPAGELTPAKGDHYRVFTPYWRAWRRTPWRRILPAPRRVAVPDSLEAGRIPTLEELTSGPPSVRLVSGGETVGRAALTAFVRHRRRAYDDRRDELAADGTSQLSPYVHFGCLSALEVAARCLPRSGGEAFVRQLCWRDFHHQVTAAFKQIAVEDYRDRGRRWRDDADAFAAWCDGRTGVPIVDAGMRQLRAEGWMHNRARLIVGSFLVRDLEIDWRLGAAHFRDWLVDADLANNSGNWQWLAGTGNDTRPNRRLNVLRQARRFDPHGDYVRRHVPELVGLDSATVHRPWTLPSAARRCLDYPEPIVDVE